MTAMVLLSFHPEHKNPARGDGRGVYRVVDSWDAETADLAEPLIRVWQRFLRMRAPRRYKRGSRVDPLKIALAARQLTA